jgi:hypothetical protein
MILQRVIRIEASPQEPLLKSFLTIGPVRFVELAKAILKKSNLEKSRVGVVHEPPLLSRFMKEEWKDAFRI